MLYNPLGPRERIYESAGDTLLFWTAS